ncbi:MAG: SUMF1/EgtB/PvdO family nonheme iron enzyme [Candidatus Latescibacteria bacterium]|nr:SUMF1/EgtB/PvdO family nonheme iron enzyme [Candidatus Latescibacterota bacterium]
MKNGRFFAFLVFLIPWSGQAQPRVEIQVGDGVPMAFIWIEPGTFAMGSPPGESGRFSDEGPVHQVTISQGFWLGQFEVTQAQWLAVMEDNPSYFEGPSRPLELVAWNDIQTFIGRLNEAAGAPLYRLPSEAEWEYAARAGSATRWAFGDDEEQLGQYAWYDGNNSSFATKDVGTRLPNAWGLFDMHGNVWEWCQDRYDSDYYLHSPAVDPPGPEGGFRRVPRGGGFFSEAHLLRSALRLGTSPSFRGNYLGARLVWTGAGPSDTAVEPASWGALKQETGP